MKAVTLTLISCICVHASVVGLHSTGVDSGFGTDSHYNLLEMPAGANYSTVPRVIYNAADIVPASGTSSWLPNGGGSAWIGPEDQVTGSEILSGMYLYVTGFMIDADLDLVNIRGLWAADGQGVDILVNGIHTGMHTVAPTSGSTFGSYSEFTSFQLNESTCPGCFGIGYNTLSFQVMNGSMESGLNVRMVANPEPATMGLVGLALVVAGALRRRARQ